MAFIVTSIFVIALVSAIVACIGCIIIPLVLLIISFFRRKKDE